MLAAVLLSMAPMLRAETGAWFRFDDWPGGMARFRAYAPAPSVTPDRPALNPTGSFTLSARVAGRWVGNSHNILAKGCNGAYRLRILKGGRLWLLLNDGHGHEIIVSKETIVPERKWVHVAAVVDMARGQVVFLADGTRRETHPITKRGVARDSGALVIGAYDATGRESFNGWLDDVRIEHRVVPDAELRARAGEGPKRPCPYTDRVLFPPVHEGPHRGDDVFHILVSARAGFRSAEEFARIKSWLAPGGDGPYVRLGLTLSLPYMAWSREDTGYVLDLDAPLARQRFASVRQWTEMAARQGIPLKIGCAGGAWFDPARDRMDASDWLERHRRNCMWYADHRVQAQTPPTVDPMPYREVERQLNGASFGDVYVTFSRYNREVQELRRRNRRAALAFIVDFYRRHPELLVAVNVDGELELALHHGDQPADYNPFAILEFRDWIRGTGEYEPRKGTLPGTGIRRLRPLWRGCRPCRLQPRLRHGLRHLATQALRRRGVRGGEARQCAGVRSRRGPSGGIRSATPGRPERSLLPRAGGAGPHLLGTLEHLPRPSRAQRVPHLRGRRRLHGLPPELIYTQTIPGNESYATARRIWLSAVPPWGGVISNGRLGLNLFNDVRPWIDPYLTALGNPPWGSPEWRYHNPCVPVETVADTLRALWAHECRFVAPLVWPNHLQDTATGAGIRQFIETYRTIPRTQAHQYRRTPPPASAPKADDTRIYGF